MVAAVSDFRPKFQQSGKLKKSMLGEEWALELTQTPDILSSLDKTDIKTIAFKAEMDAENGLDAAKALLEQKGADAVCYNLLDNSQSFGTEENEITFITQTEELSLGKADKLTLADRILAEASKLSHA